MLRREARRARAVVQAFCAIAVSESPIRYGAQWNLRPVEFGVPTSTSEPASFVTCRPERPAPTARLASGRSERVVPCTYAYGKWVPSLAVHPVAILKVPWYEPWASRSGSSAYSSKLGGEDHEPDARAVATVETDTEQAPESHAGVNAQPTP